MAGEDVGLLKGGAHSAQAHLNPFMGDCALPKENFFHLHFSVVWIGSHNTFVLCTALLTGRLSLSDVLELAIATRP